MLYYITPLIYNFHCRWYENSSNNVAVYQLNNSEDWAYVENKCYLTLSTRYRLK